MRPEFSSTTRSGPRRFGAGFDGHFQGYSIAQKPLVGLRFEVVRAKSLPRDLGMKAFVIALDEEDVEPIGPSLGLLGEVEVGGSDVELD